MLTNKNTQGRISFAYTDTSVVPYNVFQYRWTVTDAIAYTDMQLTCRKTSTTYAELMSDLETKLEELKQKFNPEETDVTWSTALLQDLKLEHKFISKRSSE